MINKKRVLILIDQKSSDESSDDDRNWSFFRESVSNSLGNNIEIVMGELKSLTFELSRDSFKVYDRKRQFSLDDFNLVIFRTIHHEWSLASSCATFLKSRGIAYIDSFVVPGFYSKFSAGAYRQMAGFSTIPTVMASNEELQYMVKCDLLPIRYPLIIKDNNGKKGRLNFLAKNKDEATKILKENQAVDFIIQEFIPNDGDYRCLVMGGKVKLVIYRQAKNGSHLNNTSQGAVARIVNQEELTPGVIKDVVKAVKLAKIEVAGADVVIDKRDNQHYLLELNYSPQIASGAFPDKKLKAYTEYIETLSLTI